MSGGDIGWSSLGSSLMVCNRDGSAERCCSSCIVSAVVLRAAASSGAAEVVAGAYAEDVGGTSGTTNRDLIGFGGAECGAGGWGCCWTWDGTGFCCCDCCGTDG